MWDPDNLDVCETQISVYQCPADDSAGRYMTHEDVNGTLSKFSRSNYVVCTGRFTTWYFTPKIGAGWTNEGAFEFSNGKSLRQFTDGLSNTVLFSEVISGKDDHYGNGDIDLDMRGVWIIKLSGAGSYTHMNPPNSLEGDMLVGKLGSDHTCQDTPKMPCRKLPNGNTEYGGSRGFASARSNHPGGVNVAFADGHARFYQDDVDWNVWQALSTIGNGD